MTGTKHNQWVKDNYQSIKGFRPKLHFSAIAEDLTSWIDLTPDDFLFNGTTKQPFMIFSRVGRVHAPRSLLKRARITINRNSGKVVAKSAMHTANK